MAVKISHDPSEPAASVELMITEPLEDFDLTQISAPAPRDVDPMLASQGFKDLLDDARALLEREFAGSALEIVQLTGAICHDRDVYRPGLWLVVREGKAAGQAMSPEGRAKVASSAEVLRTNLRLS